MKTWGKLVSMMNVSLERDPLKRVGQEYADGWAELDVNELKERTVAVMSRMMGKSPILLEADVEPHPVEGRLLYAIAVSTPDLTLYRKHLLPFDAVSRMGAFLCAYARHGKQRFDFISDTAKTQFAKRTIDATLKDTARAMDWMVCKELVPQAKYLRSMVEQLGEETVRRIIYAASCIQQNMLAPVNFCHQKDWTPPARKNGIKVTAPENFSVNHLLPYQKEVLDSIISINEGKPPLASIQVPVALSREEAEHTSKTPAWLLPKVAPKDDIEKFAKRVAGGFAEAAEREIVVATVNALCNRLFTRFWTNKLPGPITDAYVALHIKDREEVKPVILVGTEELLQLLFPEDWHRFYIPELCRYKTGSWRTIRNSLDQLMARGLRKNEDGADIEFRAYVLCPGLFFQPNINSRMDGVQSCISYLGLNDSQETSATSDWRLASEESMNRSKAEPHTMKAKRKHRKLPGWMKPAELTLGEADDT